MPRNDELHLHHENLPLLREVSSSLQIIAVTGEGRAGKSDLSNQWLGRPAFPTGDSGDAVTSGVDFVMKDTSLLLDSRYFLSLQEST